MPLYANLFQTAVTRCRDALKFGLLPALLTCITINPVAADQRPNILLIVSEDNGPELGCYGDPYARTPNLDRLAQQGLQFNRAFVPQSGCSQSRASFLTGLYPHQHGQIGLATWGFRLFDAEINNLPRSLKSVGYRTGLIGKLHINPASAFPFDMHEIQSSNFGRKQLGDYASFAQKFISEDDQPFFLSVNYPDPHDPWLAQVEGLPKMVQTGEDVKAMPYMGIDSPEFRDMIADYYNCISRMDSLVGDLLQVLRDTGKDENTLVIYIGDHGADMLRGKRTCYEGGLRIPMLIRWPGKITPQVRDEMVSTLDLMPTLLEAANAPALPGLPGESLSSLFTVGTPEWRTHLFAEYHTHAAAPNYFPQRSVRDERYKLIVSLLPNETHPDYQKTLDKLHEDFRGQSYEGQLDLKRLIAKAHPTVRSAYQLMRQPPQFQLYDLKIDPFEFKNLANEPEHADKLDELKEQLENWRHSSHDPLLDTKKLGQLTAEVQALTKKSLSRKHDWRYPAYLRASSKN